MRSLQLETGIGSLQWFVFLLANSLTLPIVIGQAYQLPADEIAGLMQRTFMVVGLSSFLTAWLGHRLPIPDGPAGIWLGVFVLMGELAASQGTDQSVTLQLLEGGMLVTGTILIIIGATGLMDRMLTLFTPLVTGAYLMLLAFQLSGVFLKGMIGVSTTSSEINPVNVVIAFAVFALVLSLSIWGKGWLKSYAVLIGIIMGWLAFALVNGSGSVPTASSIVLLPEIFAWGLPRLDGGMAVSAVIVAFVLVTNIIASMAAMQQVLGGKPEKQALNRGGLMGGVANVLSSVFSSVGVVPLSIAAGFVRMTGQSRLLPFFIACLALTAVALVPSIYSFLSLLPGPVAYAAMLASFTQMVGIGLSAVLKVPLDERRLTILGVSLSFGIGVMFLPQAIFSALPTVLQYVLGNGLMVGMLLSLLLEHSWRPPKKEENTLAAS
ncbi:purine/pyrimidine permease [Brevibacillus sp. Leaf182]|uniref:purine/pyrimidine permease n=1 Tax=Brevibacillus sp. Leaf182 TaxID=1736290 RepID=UPI0006F9170D|nr:purine/pyrimidine permease [Brevibacillus sp. Leaf182]RAT96771.1 xanthine permease [Brevibacillus sp. Leaf182]